MKKNIRSIFSLCMAAILLVAFIQPSMLKGTVAAFKNSKQLTANLQWKKEAMQQGEDICSFDDTVYFAETKEKNIVPITDGAAYVNNEVVIFFEDDASVADKKSVIESIDGQVIGCADIANQYQVQIKERSLPKLQLLCTKLMANKNVMFAGCNMAMIREEDVVLDDPWANPTDSYPPTIRWEDSYVYGPNWALKATQTTSAWDHSAYFNHINIGIVDSGFEVDHEDLQGKISFPGSYFEKDNIPSSHGTHVAGIIAANGGNKIGTAGICQNADLICTDWQPDKEAGQKWSTDVHIFTGFIALVKAGAKVINLSLGSAGNYKEEDSFSMKVAMYFEGMIFSYMMASLLTRGYDFIAVQSAGNGAKNGYPCDSYFNGSFCAVTKKNMFRGFHFISKQEILDHIIVVGSATSSHKGSDFYMSSFSNYGPGVSIFAPGSSVFSTDLTESTGGYSYKSGTSMAAPVVTAITAMTWSVNPALKGSEVKKIVCNPENTIYNCINYYNSEAYTYDDSIIDIPSCPMINAKLSVEAALKTLPQNAEPVQVEGQNDFFTLPVDVNPTKDPVPVKDNSTQDYIDQFAFEVGE